MHDLLSEWLVKKLQPGDVNMLFRGHIDLRGTIEKQFEVVVRVDPITRLGEEFEPYLGVVSLRKTHVPFGWEFSFSALHVSAGSLEDQMRLIVSGWQRKVNGWARQQERYCSTAALPGSAISMQNSALTTEVARIHGAVVAQELSRYGDRWQRVLKRADRCLAQMISSNQRDDANRHQYLR